MAAIETYIADYDDPVQAKTVSDLLNGYALDQFGNSGPLDDDVRAKLCSELAKIQGAFSVVATVEGVPVGLINCFQGFSTFKCKPLVNIHDVFVVPEHRRKGVTQVMMAKVAEAGGGGRVISKAADPLTHPECDALFVFFIGSPRLEMEKRIFVLFLVVKSHLLFGDRRVSLLSGSRGT